MLKKIKQFIKSSDRKFSYTTMAAVIIAVAFIAVASVMAANEDVKKIIGEEIVEKSGVDNTVLLATDLENFDLKMEITGAMEDSESFEDSESGKSGNYYISYQYNTLAIKDNVWQEVLRQEKMTVSKASLDGRDLGLYLMEELGEVIDYQLAFLKEVQEKEEEKGVTVVLEKTEYTGLIGLVFNTKTKELPGYEPVVKPPVAEENISTDDDEIPPAPFVKGGDDDVPSDSEEDDYLENSAYYEFLISNCLDSDGHWYNNTCNAEAEVEEEESNQVPQPSGTMEPAVDEEDLADEEPVVDEQEDEPVIEEEPTEPAEEEPIEDDPTADEEPAEETEPESEDLGDEALEDETTEIEF